MKSVASSRNRTVIIAEENYLTGLLLAESVAIAGRESMIVRDGAELLRTIKKSNAEILLLNLSIANPGGIELLRRIAALRTRLRVIAFSAPGQTEYRQAAISSGVEYFETPFHPLSLAEIITSRPPAEVAA